MSPDPLAGPLPATNDLTGKIVALPRIKLVDLLQQMREVEIDHDGKIYRLRLTQTNKLILTA